MTEYGGSFEDTDDEEEEEEQEVVEEWSDDRKAAGTRLFVLTPHGETLQVWKPEGGRWEGGDHGLARAQAHCEGDRAGGGSGEQTDRAKWCVSAVVLEEAGTRGREGVLTSDVPMTLQYEPRP